MIFVEFYSKDPLCVTRLIIVRLMDFKQGLDRTKNTPIVLKGKMGIKLKVIMSSFISRLSSGQKSVASYCKMGR